jgi:hypothetical protein
MTTKQTYKFDYSYKLGWNNDTSHRYPELFPKELAQIMPKIENGNNKLITLQFNNATFTYEVFKTDELKGVVEIKREDTIEYRSRTNKV